MDIQELEMHIDNCANDVVSVREFCGNERGAILDYQSENGIKFNPIECVHIAQRVREIWSGFQKDAGVVAPLTTSERFSAYKALESV